jgi:hypothetical protein
MPDSNICVMSEAAVVKQQQETCPLYIAAAAQET